MLCCSCLSILSSRSAVISELLTRSHPSDVTPGGVIGSVLPRTIAGNSFHLFSDCYQDVDLTSHSLEKQRKTSYCKTASETSLLLCPLFAVCSLQDSITLLTKLESFQWEEIQLAPHVLTPLLTNWARLELIFCKILSAEQSTGSSGATLPLFAAVIFHHLPRQTQTGSQFLVVNVDTHWCLL